MFRRPKDIDDHEQCVKEKNNRIYVFCVECDTWHSVAIRCRAIVTYTQNGTAPRIGEGDDLVYVCLACEESVGYLLSPIQKATLVKRIDVR